MSLSQIPSRLKQRPSSLDEIEPISSYSKDNTEKSMQGSLYDCEMNSMNTYGLSSNRSRARRRESISAKSRISSKNMIDFEEFTLENPNDNLLQTQILENNNSYLSSITTRNKEPEVIKEIKEEDCLDQAAPAEFLRVDTDEKPYKSDKADETQPILSPKAEDNVILPPEIETGNNEMILDQIEPASGAEEEKLQEKREEEEEEKVATPVREQNVNLVAKKGRYRHDNRFSDRIMSFEDYSARRRSENIISSDNTFEVEEKSDNKAKFATEFRSLKDEVVTIQRDLKSSEAYNKKLEEYIHTQKIQIETILANFNAIGEENNALKKKLPEALRKSAEQKKEVKQTKEEIYKEIDHIISKKANKYYKQEMELNKEKYNKTFQNFEKIISDLHKQLDAKDFEIKELQAQNAIANSLAKNMSSKSQSLFDQLHVSRTIGSNKELKSPEFNSISKAQISEDRYLGGSCDEPNDIKSPRTLRELNRQVSPTDMKYIQYMADISEKMDEMKRNDHKLTKRTTHSMKPQIPTGLPDKSLKGMSKEPRSFSSEPHKLTLQGSTFEETFLDDPKGSMIEASFDISTAKNSNKKDIDELSTFNLSPSKTKHMPLLKQERSKKSLPSSQNASQMNEMSMIHETLSENFVTESIHSKLAWEFQKQFGFGPKKSVDSAKLPSRGSKEDSQDRDYGYIEKMHRYIQGSKKKGSSSTSGSKISYTDKTLSKDQISLQRSKDESTSFNNSSGNLKGKDYYFANSVSKGENANVLKTSNQNIPSSTLTTNQSLKPSRTLSNYDKPNDSYSKALPKNAEKKSRSATNSQDKIAKKDKPEGKGKGYEHSSLQTQSNDTIIYINSALDKMLDKGQQKTYSLLEREKKFMKTQPYRKSDVMPDLDDMYPLPSQSDSDYNQIKLSTAPLSSYLQLARTGSLENPSSHTSLKTNILDIENKENFAEHPSRSSASSRKGPKHSGQTSTQINLDEPAFYNASIDKLGVPPKSVGEHTKGSGYKRPSTTSNSQARHHTPTTKVYLDVFPPNETKEQVMKIPKKVERIFPREMDEINLNTIDNFNNKLMGKPRSSSNKASSNKSGTRGSQGYTNYPMYNNLVLDEFGSNQPGGKTGKTPNYRSGTDQKSYDYMHQVDRENPVRKNKEESSKYESENMPNGPEMYIGQPQSKNRRESYRPYNVYNYDSKKYMQ